VNGQKDRAAESSIAEQLLALEKSALVRWCAGDPSGYLEISAEDVVYFDPFIERRLDGLAALTAYYEALRGKISAERFDILNPQVQAVRDMAVLTFNFVSFARDGSSFRWNCTEVYRRAGESWRIIQSHWSFTQPG
jgi:ketosteroid isomerase-like protein